MLSDATSDCDSEPEVRLDDVEDRRRVEIEDRLEVVLAWCVRLDEPLCQGGPQTWVQTKCGCPSLEAHIVEEPIRSKADQRLQAFPRLASLATALHSLPDGPPVLSGSRDVSVAVVDGDPLREVFIDQRIQTNEEPFLGIHREHERHVDAGDIASDHI